MVRVVIPRWALLHPSVVSTLTHYSHGEPKRATPWNLLLSSGGVMEYIISSSHLTELLCECFISTCHIGMVSLRQFFIRHVDLHPSGPKEPQKYPCLVLGRPLTFSSRLVCHSNPVIHDAPRSFYENSWHSLGSLYRAPDYTEGFESKARASVSNGGHQYRINTTWVDH